jgi:NhaP-type Na+/H+ or K+/H+ antiporter
VFIGWFGPRGLSSLLLALLAVQAGVPRAEYLLSITGVVVIASVLLHGATATPLSAWYGRRVARETLPEERESTAAGLLGEKEADVARITPEALAGRLAEPIPPLVLDVRSRSQYAADEARIPGSVHALPDEVMEWAAEQPRARAIVTYCT